jgi:hypothetical protein
MGPEQGRVGGAGLESDGHFSADEQYHLFRAKQSSLRQSNGHRRSDKPKQSGLAITISHEVNFAIGRTAGKAGIIAA